MADVTFSKPLPISKNWKLIATIGGKKMVHARGCEFIRDWDVNGCYEVTKLKPQKQKLCPQCSKVALATLGAKDFLENLPRYKKFFENISYSAISQLYYENKAKTEWVGDRLYIQCNLDNWYVDFTYNVRLFHNDYNMKQRDAGESFDVLGYHEHEVSNGTDAFKQIAKYRYKEASKVHAKKRNSRPRTTFSELDPEYWGFES